jgi:4-azaleucine resistance transporter AzlC
MTDADAVKEDAGWSTDHLRRGVRAAWPICVGYLPIGLAFGVLAQKAGLNPIETGLMSVVVFAGSSQFIAVSMLSGGAAAVSIVVTTFVVNLRHVLMSSSLAVCLRNTNASFLTLFAYGVTDESFAVNMSRFRDGDWGRREALVVNHVSNGAWILSSIAGGYSGRFIPAGSFGIDYALMAMFICLLVLQLRGRIYTITAVMSGTVAVLLSLLIPGNSYVVVASLSAATAGFALRRYAQKQRAAGVQR